jgi:hypothetical protein
MLGYMNTCDIAIPYTYTTTADNPKQILYIIQNALRLV